MIYCYQEFDKRFTIGRGAAPSTLDTSIPDSSTSYVVIEQEESYQPTESSTLDTLIPDIFTPDGSTSDIAIPDDSTIRFVTDKEYEGLIYCGLWKNGKPEVYGALYSEEGNYCYIGGFNNGLFHSITKHVSILLEKMELDIKVISKMENNPAVRFLQQTATNTNDDWWKGQYNRLIRLSHI